jgi:hypothetical protein
MTREQIEIPSRFNGPPGSGHGGYVSGRLAEVLVEPAEVTLRAPTPLDKPLDLEWNGGTAGLRDGETLIAEGRAIEPLELEIPAPVGLEEAERARSRYRSHVSFRTCFVCGSSRTDAQRVYAGPVDDRSQAASPWTPADVWLDDGAGNVRPAFVWSVLDCPTYHGFFVDSEPGLAMLGRFAVRRIGPVRMGEPHVITAWRIARDGRKLLAGAALFTAEGGLRACARATMIEIDEIPEGARG